MADKDLTTQRLLQNQTDIGNAIKPYYGNDAGDKLTALLKDHILGAAELLAAAKAGDSAKVDVATAKWYTNADDIAAVLSGANPKSWPLADMKMHLDLTLEEAVARLKGDFATDIKDYDRVHGHILGLADTLSTGSKSQFPEKNTPAVLPVTGADDHHAHVSQDAWLLFLIGPGLVLIGWFLRKWNIRVG